jgi:trk system potassium uptake protein TrkH
LSYSGLIIFIIGFLYLIPLAVIPFYQDEIVFADDFLLVSIPLIVVGGVFWKSLLPEEQPKVSYQEGAVIISIVWLVGILSGSIPFMTAIRLNFSQAVFESTSGWTTTGLSVVDVTNAPRIILFYRSLLQLAGGAGLAIITLSAIAGPIGYGLSLAEGRSEQLAPHVRRSATIVLSLYMGYVVAGTVALFLVGMNWFDAVNHAFAALSTGGFSTRPESIGYWDNPLLEGVIIVLMILGTVNFLTSYIFIRGKFRAVFKNGEIRVLFALIIIASILLFSLITINLYASTSKSVRVAIFESTTAVSTTGFSTVGYGDWLDFGWLVLIVLMLVGGGTGSTAGGIKQYRAYVLYKAIAWEFRKGFMPQHTVNEPAIWQGERRELLSDRQVRQVALFIGLYMTFFVFGSGVLTAHGYSLKESLFEFASSLGTVGLSIGLTTPEMPVLVMWTQTLAMLLGRLEFFAILVGFMKLITDTRILSKPGGKDNAH